MTNHESKCIVVSFTEGVFYFYPGKVKDGHVRVYNSRNHFIGYASVADKATAEDDVAAWLVKQRIVAA